MACIYMASKNQGGLLQGSLLFLLRQKETVQREVTISSLVPPLASAVVTLDPQQVL